MLPETCIPGGELLTAGERDTVDAALRRGWLMASGERLAVLLAYRQRCTTLGRKAVTVRTGCRMATVEIDGRTAWRGPVARVSEAAGGLAKPGLTRLQPPGATIGGRTGLGYPGS